MAIKLHAKLERAQLRLCLRKVEIPNVCESDVVVIELEQRKIRFLTTISLSVAHLTAPFLGAMEHLATRQRQPQPMS